MNRKDRRRLKKQGRAGGAPMRPATRRPAGMGVSGMLLRYAGQDRAPPIDKAALDIIAAQAKAGPVEAAFAKLRRREILEQEVSTIEHALEADPNSIALLSTLAKLHRHLDQPGKALAAYRRIVDIDPGREDARHMIAALEGAAAAKVPSRASDAFVAAEFDGFAESYDKVLVGMLEYRGPEVVHRAVRAVLGDDPPPQDVIDLGCGTGLNAPLFRPLARRLDGVDLSSKMIEKARGRALYDDLAVGEIVFHLLATARRYTLALAADVLIYFGDLGPVFRAVHGALGQGGLFVFTVEAGEGEPYRLTPSGRYAHDDAYVRAVAQAAGFAVDRVTDETLRKERLAPVMSRCYVLRRT